MSFCPDCQENDCKCGKWLRTAAEKKALPSFEIKEVVQGGISLPLDPPVRVIIDRDTLVIN